MTREPIEVTRQDRIYCLKASSDYHSEVCEECKFYPNCDHTTQDDMTELTIKDLESLEQDPFKPMIEIDLYSVIKQKYIEREVLDKIRAEIAEYGSIWVEYKITGRRDMDIEQLVSDVLSQAKKQVFDVIDKYKAESEVENGNDNN